MGAADLAFSFRGAYAPAVSRAYLSRKLTRPLVTKDGGTLRTGNSNSRCSMTASSTLG